MKCCLGVLLFLATSCFGQGWEAEIMTGTSTYKGDLTQQQLIFRNLRASVAANLKYNFGNAFTMRTGFAFARLAGNDKYNRRQDLKDRNLNFKTNILEYTICLEYNLLEQEIFYAYPYVVGGVGLFHFDPFTYDKDQVKTFLRPLSTEGQGLPGYEERKTYSKTQFCLPFGIGWKWKLESRFSLAYEFGGRLLFTDYLDDVSTNYINEQTLLTAKGPKAVELANRSPHPVKDGAVRGNPDVKDWYFFNSIKLSMQLGKGY